jgi:hypothetical protein
MGDWADMESLSSYDKGKKEFEGRRYKADIVAANEALELFEEPIAEYNKQRRKNGKKQYKPRKISLVGNHEERIIRAISSNPELDGTIGIGDILFQRYNWEIVSYRVPVFVDGIAYCHNFPSGVKGEAISGLNIAASLLAKHMSSVTVGHIHIFDHATRCTPMGKRYHGLSAGCFHDHTDSYAENVAHMWWRGLVLKTNVRDGDYDFETFRMDRIKELYGTSRSIEIVSD